MSAVKVAALVMMATALSGCWWQTPDDALQGYVEGDFLDVGAEETARLVSLDVARGDEAGANAVLFRLDDSDARQAREEALARVAQAQAQLEDMKTGKRAEEIDVLKARRDQIVASLSVARRDHERVAKLHDQKIVSDAQADESLRRVQDLEAQLASMDSEIEVAGLAARPQALLAAEHAVDAAQASLTRAEERIRRLTGVAPLAGSVQDTYFEPGEVVPAGRPVVSVLPPQNLKVRFFVPEPDLSRFGVGDDVEIGCDGCAAPIPATVSYVSREAEFTPPVIYSVHARQKLVYMIEAKPAEVAGLKVGQPVDVRSGR